MITTILQRNILYEIGIGVKHKNYDQSIKRIYDLLWVSQTAYKTWLKEEVLSIFLRRFLDNAQPSAHDDYYDHHFFDDF